MAVRKKQKFEWLRWLKTPYRVVVIDEKTLEEVAAYRLRKMNLYILLSTLMILVALLTFLLITFTPLRYYLPGYGSKEERIAVQQMQWQLDSLTQKIDAQDVYLNGLKKVLVGDFDGVRDTNMINMDALRNEKLKSYFPATDTIKQEAMKELEDQKQIDSGAKKTNTSTP